ncbi:TrmB family transcriptional regulator sugar-binding domain-containing protein [Haloarcula halophila]|uniref:TrmB family transcriptional regulator sugar-binding domain-containing protein n=1 Tax=Haloarcula halophila TaxID=3032584 RepID=UPI0023E3A0BB|nr:TrmB family transcriptional regulator sugar-binding domain-containing protein [Halomicroarcula sp. DFY41]
MADRDHALYWARRGFRGQSEDDQAYYVSNPRLVFVLDRFVSESVWPYARSIAGQERSASLPSEYLRIRDCLEDIDELADRRPIDDIEVKFEGYDTESGEAVERAGTLTSYYFTEYDIRASLTLSLHLDADTVQPTLASVGGIGARKVDYAAERIVIREYDGHDSNDPTNETARYLKQCRSELPTELGDASIAIGFDAFVDRMREFIEPSGDRYNHISQFERFRESLVKYEASESSPRALWRETETEPGGHASHLGNVFNGLGYDLTLVGRFGSPIHPEFESAFNDQTIISVGPTTSTDYVRFKNRNFLLTEPNTDPLNWSTLTEQSDRSKLVDSFDETAAVALGTWWATPDLPDILEGMAEELWPQLESPPSFVHLSTGQVSELSSETIEWGCDALKKLDEHVSVVVTANRDQTRQLCDTLVPDSGTKSSVQRLRKQLGVSQFVMHSLKGATLASADGVLTVSTPQIPSPRRVRNVDDHFKSGYVLGLAEGLSAGASLVLGNAIAGYFVRYDRTPDEEELRSYLADYHAHYEES